MVIKVRAIKASKFAVSDNVSDLIANQLGPIGVAGGLIRAMADYPSQRATKSGYIRSGDLGRGWKMTKFVRGHRQFYSEVENRITYAGRVQGRRRGRKGPGTQTREMKRRGWLSIEAGVRRVWPQYRRTLIRILGQTDSRVRARRRRFR